MALSDDVTLLAYVRSMLPVVSASDDAYVTDAQLDYLYANKAESDADKTIAWALRQMCIRLSGKVSKSNARTGDSTQDVQEREAVCEAANMWANLAGVNTGQLGTVTTGSINLGIDEEDDLFDIT